jgi:hypothetical protein
MLKELQTSQVVRLVILMVKIVAILIYMRCMLIDHVEGLCLQGEGGLRMLGEGGGGAVNAGIVSRGEGRCCRFT